MSIWKGSHMEVTYSESYINSFRSVHDITGDPLHHLTDLHTTWQRKHTSPSIAARWCVGFPTKMADGRAIEIGPYRGDSSIPVDFAVVTWFTMKNNAHSVGRFCENVIRARTWIVDSRSGVFLCKLGGVHDVRLCVLVRLCRFLLGGV